eukprot:CAMPEP_0178930374 /NCGR_PEP_ID=MMETSP0786-20121207/21184_1 /TAXON_ID=186022 /ORGANISM="Thalassionema frauenfeldii, Strain CCMP 1798" /LENGTH=353 /DNA_ID=CAMNT_0020606863 /DNA_START=1 /DNA_END=1060 /DNA_ORIENTATION=+
MNNQVNDDKSSSALDSSNAQTPIVPTLSPVIFVSETPTESPINAVPTMAPTPAKQTLPTRQPTSRPPPNRPTEFPTLAPTMANQPTSYPTIPPTREPTNYPTSTAPTKPPSKSPTKFPTAAPTPILDIRTQRYFALVAALQAYSITFISDFVDGSPQARALNWLLDEDPLVLLESTVNIPAGRIFQRYILATLFFRMEGDRWNRKGNWLTSTHECNWIGISCEDKYIASYPVVQGDYDLFPLSKERMVTDVDLEKNISYSLHVLSLYGNELSGPLPTTLGNMVELEKLWIDENSLNGTLPTELGLLTNLDDLSIYENHFEGSLPTEFGQLTQIERIWANNMRLAGSIPTEFGK